MDSGTLLARVENHHNFAREEKYNGEDVIVHRKRATPASKDVMGIIPGSMTAPQSHLVDVVAKFTPKMLRMADDGSRED